MTRLATSMLVFVLFALAPSPALASGRDVNRPHAGRFASNVLSTNPTPANPTRSQIQRAVRTAEHSNRLWATINICDTRRHPHTLGIRGQVPALGFPASISIGIAVQFWNPAKRRFIPDPSARKLIRLPNVSDGIHQQGVTFEFSSHAGRLRGAATFSWKRSGKVLGTTDRLTTAGHRDADFSDPRGFSAATCTIR